MWHKPCRTFHPWCPCIKTCCLLSFWSREQILIKFESNHKYFNWNVYAFLKSSTKFPPFVTFCKHFICYDHYVDVIMSAMASQTTGVSIVYSIVCSGVDRRKHQSSVLLAFVRGIQRWPVNSPQKWPVTRKMLPFDDVIMHECVWFMNEAIENRVITAPDDGLACISYHDTLLLIGLNTLRPRSFQMHFLEWKYVDFYWNLTEVCYQGSN